MEKRRSLHLNGAKGETFGELRVVQLLRFLLFTPGGNRLVPSLQGAQKKKFLLRVF
jgi:hypothetical protein